MSKRPIIATFLTVVALALLLSFKTPQGLTAANGGNGGGNGVVNAAATNSVNGAGNGGGNGGGTVTSNGSFSGQLTGQAVDIPFGTVQVKVTMQNGKITDVQTLQLPRGGHSGQVSSYAAPQLRSEALQAQSANIDTISGATYTSQGYAQSLQSALSQAA
jgi:uncharacterized protein with FMN-binding domain